MAKEFEPIYEQFWTALDYVVSKDWKGRKKVLAIEANISGGYLSDILHKNRRASYKIQSALAKACGYKKYEDFLTLGRRLLEGKAPEPEQPPAKEITPIPNLRRITDRTGEGDTREGIISLFQDREMARQMILRLVELEKGDRESFIRISGYIQCAFDALAIKKEA